MHHVKEVKLLVDNLNKHRHAYYNLNAPVISDAEYELGCYFLAEHSFAVDYYFVAVQVDLRLS